MSDLTELILRKPTVEINMDAEPAAWWCLEYEMNLGSLYALTFARLAVLRFLAMNKPVPEALVPQTFYWLKYGARKLDAGAPRKRDQHRALFFRFSELADEPFFGATEIRSACRLLAKKRDKSESGWRKYSDAYYSMKKHPPAVAFVGEWGDGSTIQQPIKQSNRGKFEPSIFGDPSDDDLRRNPLAFQDFVTKFRSSPPEQKFRV